MNRPGIIEREIKSVPKPALPTLRETVANLPANIAEAALLETAALTAYRELQPGDKQENAARYFIRQARCEKAGWRDYLSVYRVWLETHPDLADLPIGTRCKHGHGCSLDSPLPSLLRRQPPDREVGADDEGYQQDRRLPPEKDQELPF